MGQPHATAGTARSRSAAYRTRLRGIKRISFLPRVCQLVFALLPRAHSGSAREAELSSTAMRRFAVAASALLTAADIGSAVLVFAAVHGWQWHGLLRAWVRPRPSVTAPLLCTHCPLHRWLS